MSQLVSRRAALLRGGSTVAGAGLITAALAQTQTAAAATVGSALSLYDFGAKANGSDDSAALSKALAVAAAEGRVIVGTGDTFTIATPVYCETKNHTVRDWGFLGQGDKFISAIRTNASIITIQGGRGFHCRALKLMNFAIRGTRADGNGLALMCPAGANLYNILVHAVTVENVGGSGFYLEGNVFETAMVYCQASDCIVSGMRFSHGRTGFGGVLSAIYVTHPILAQNGVGVEVLNWARDVVVEAGYIRQSQRNGVYLSNGNDKPWRGVGFENNYISQKPSPTSTNAHILAANNFLASGLNFYDEFGGAKFGICVPNPINPTIIRDTKRTSGPSLVGRGDATGGEHLLVGPGKGPVILDGCSGGAVVFQPGYVGKWKISHSQLENYPDITATYSSN
jgi:hypothetical protein